MSQTCWASCIVSVSVKTIRFQTSKIRYALFELVEASVDPKIKSETNCLRTYEL